MDGLIHVSCTLSNRVQVLQMRHVGPYRNAKHNEHRIARVYVYIYTV